MYSIKYSSSAPSKERAHFQIFPNSSYKITFPTQGQITYATGKYKIKTHRNVNLPVVLCGCETWSVTLRKKHRHRKYGTRVLSKIFWARETRYQSTGEDCLTRSFMIFTPHQLYYPAYRNKKQVRTADSSSVYTNLVGKHRVKRSLGRPRRTRKDNIKMYLQGTGWGRGMD